MTELERFAKENAVSPKFVLDLICTKNSMTAKHIKASIYEMSFFGDGTPSPLASEINGKLIDIMTWKIVEYTQERRRTIPLSTPTSG